MNEQFLKNMQNLLGDEYPAYLKCLDQPARRGFRVNTLKTTSDHLFQKLSISREKSPFADNGYYTDAPSGIGYTPESLAGTFYMQEPSASSAVTILDPKPGMKVLDLCAAPGSKSTQILEKLKNQGLLVANEIDHRRAQILLENIVRNGAGNAIVLNDDTSVVADTFPEYFDAVLCDAPCSGEGMMRKEKEASLQWTPELVEHCASLQKEILENAYRCLKPGGTLVYSTCTLNTKENEEQVLSFLQRHPDMRMENPQVSFGRPGLYKEKNLNWSVRIFPMDGGEGHFAARMHKDGDPEEHSFSLLKSENIPKDLKQTLVSDLDPSYPYLYLKNGRLYGGTCPFINTGRCHLLRNQVYLGDVKKGRFEYAYPAFLSSFAHFRKHYDLNDEEVKKYLHGEQISASVEKGWYAMCYHGYSLGGAKSDGKALKNHYPKQYRFR